jgi:hypothetical protein
VMHAQRPISRDLVGRAAEVDAGDMRLPSFPSMADRAQGSSLQ